ncbi:rotatin isoform X2 [Narcine bancroftii]|uniref:rotatin isoform X2 n=1 Tax=Narcine bancroftii TaxID=1343680 RepID=UPI0038311716
MDLSGLITKLGHQLVEIRVRALKNILCKIDHGLISIVDLAQEKSLFFRLFEWFNFQCVPMQGDVLKLCGRLVKYSSVAQIFREIGALEFLAQLRANVEPNLQVCIDEIMDDLLKLPDTFVDVGSAIAYQSQPLKSSDKVVPTVPPEVQETMVGYFQRRNCNPVEPNKIQPRRAVVNDTVKCLKYFTFPWLTLTMTDRHVLLSNESSLKSSSRTLIRNTCELLQDVIMQDFPAEIFLQRPKIVQNLLLLTKLAFERDGTQHLAILAIGCLTQLSRYLQSRLNFHRDPSFFCAKQDLVSQNSSLAYSQEARGMHVSQNPSPRSTSPRPSVIGRTVQRPRGDGQDGDAVSSSASSSQGIPNSRSPISKHSVADLTHLELPEMETEDSLELQFQQLSLPQFCVAVLEHAVPLLRIGSRKTVICVLELLTELVVLIKDSISEDIWEDESLIGRELRDSLRATLDALGEVLAYHSSSITVDQPEVTLVHHRMAFVSIALFTMRLLQTVLPVEKAGEVLPESIGNALYLLSLDVPFCLTYLSIHESIAVYLEQISLQSYHIYKRATEVAHSMEYACSFINDVETKSERNLMELIELADQAVISLPYHQQVQLIQKYIGICSEISKSSQPSPVLQGESQKVFLKLLSHPMPIIKAESYHYSLTMVKDCLGISNVTKPVSSVSHGVHFLLHPRVLYEICTFGLQDSVEKVNTAAKDILLYLMQGYLVMSTLTWNMLLEALYPVIPILQGFASVKGPLGRCILALSEPYTESAPGILSRTARIHASLRLFMSKQNPVRSVAITHLMPHLINEEGASNKQPALQGSKFNDVSDLFILDKPIDLQLEHNDTTFFNDDSVCRVYEILISETVDLILRKSAAEQLAIMAQDAKIHEGLKNLGIVEKIVSFTHESVHKTGKTIQCLVLPCLSVLRKLVYLDPTLRHDLAQRGSLLLALFRVSLILQKDGETGSEVTALLTLLLFDEIARVETWSDNVATASPFSLPVIVTQRYNLMVKVAVHHAVSPYRIVVPSASDPLNLRPASDMLKVAWNLAWYHGVEQTLDQNGCQGVDSSLEFPEDMRLSPVDKVVLKASHVTSGLQDCLLSITQANSHSAVNSALARMTLYLLNDKLALKQGIGSNVSILHNLEWHMALGRFLQVLPACIEDEKLLADVLSFLTKILLVQRDDTDPKCLRSVLELLVKQESSSLLNLLVLPESPAQGEMDEVQSLVRQKLQKELTGFFSAILRSLTFVTDRKCLFLAGPFRTQLSLKLLQYLRITDGPHFYGLPSLERALHGMVHVTALPGWSLHSCTVDSYSLCAKYLTSLMEVISSFYVEWGGNAVSFMGKGVTKNTVICLLQLSCEMKAQAKDKNWISMWSLVSGCHNEDHVPSQLDLTWLIPLWVDRDPEVRFGSLGIGSALTLVESGCVALAASCQNISGGLWGTVLNIFLDQSECSMVRKEAASILQNLLIIRMPATLEEVKGHVWQSPCVYDEESGLSLVGLPALQALLYHCQFYEHVAHMAKHCYLGRYMFDLNFPKPAGSSLFSTTLEDTDSLQYWRVSPSLSNHSQSSRFPSTSSTVILPDSSQSDVAPDMRGLLQVSAISPIPIPESPINRLTAQGQSDSEITESLHSENSHASDSSTEQCAVVTLQFLSTVCSFLTNLLAVIPEDTLTAFKQNHLLAAFNGLINTSLFEKCLWELGIPLTRPNHIQDIKVQVLSYLQYISSMSGLIHSSLILHPELINQDDLLKPLLSNIFAVLCIRCKDYFGCEITSSIYQAWTDLFILLNTILRKCGQAVLPAITTAVSKSWATLLETVSLCIQLSTTDPSLHMVSLQFISLLLMEEGKKQLSTESHSIQCLSLTELLDAIEDDVSSGSKLAESLLQSYEGKSLEDVQRKVSAGALIALLPVSVCAQKHALQAGLVDSCIEQMKQTYVQFNLDSLRPGKVVQRKKDDPLSRELKTVMQLLRNCLYHNVECKVAASDAHLVNAIHSLWPWLLMDEVLMLEALQLLCVYTANLPASSISQCCCAGGSAVPHSSQKGVGGSSLVHMIMKQALQKTHDNNAIQPIAFAVLSNLAMSNECKGILQKSNFLHNFLSLPLPKTAGKQVSNLAMLWLKLLLNLSFGDEGQQMILKMNGSLELLTTLSQQKCKSNPPTVLLVLHNICFHPANKPKVLANDKTVSIFAACLESDNPVVQTIGSSALWALLHNYQKAKVTLKNPSIKRRVDETYLSVKKCVNGEEHQKIDSEVKRQDEIKLRCAYPKTSKMIQLSWERNVNGMKQNIAVYHPQYGESIPPAYNQTVTFLSAITSGDIKLKASAVDEGIYQCSINTFPDGIFLKKIAVVNPDFNLFLIIGAVISGILLLIISCVVCVYRRKWRRDKRQLKSKSSQQNQQRRSNQNSYAFAAVSNQISSRPAQDQRQDIYANMPHPTQKGRPRTNQWRQ